MLIKPVMQAAVAVAALSLTTVSFAGGYTNCYGDQCGNNKYYTAAPVPVATAAYYPVSGQGFVIGVQGGYADTHWSNLDVFDPTLSGTGFAARGYLGYDFSKYFGLETGYTFLPKADDDFGNSIHNYAIDLVGKLSVPVVDGFSVHAKAGGSYLHASIDNNIAGADDNASHFGPAYGVGASYDLTPNFALGVDWMRYSGNGKIGSSDYLPQQDAVFLGLSYKFQTSFS